MSINQGEGGHPNVNDMYVIDLSTKVGGLKQILLMQFMDAPLAEISQKFYSHASQPGVMYPLPIFVKMEVQKVLLRNQIHNFCNLMSKCWDLLSGNWETQKILLQIHVPTRIQMFRCLIKLKYVSISIFGKFGSNII